jgi:hypothetical protein
VRKSAGLVSYTARPARERFLWSAGSPSLGRDGGLPQLRGALLGIA